jgi:hypothetical protein
MRSYMNLAVLALAAFTISPTLSAPTQCRHHMPDDLESAYVTDAIPSSYQRQQFYNSSVDFQTTSFGANMSDSNPNSEPPTSDAVCTKEDPPRSPFPSCRDGITRGCQ